MHRFIILPQRFFLLYFRHLLYYYCTISYYYCTMSESWGYDGHTDAISTSVSGCSWLGLTGVRLKGRSLREGRPRVESQYCRHTSADCEIADAILSGGPARLETVPDA